MTQITGNAVRIRDTDEVRRRFVHSMMRLMCDNVPDLIWAKDLDGRFMFVNRAMCERLLNASDFDEPIGKTDMFFAKRERASHPDDPTWHNFGEICVNSDQVVLDTERSARFDEFGNVQGQFLYLDVYKAPFRDEQGEIIGTVGCGRDITAEKRIDEQRKQAERALRESEERYRLLVELSPDGIAVGSGDRFVFANSSAAKILGAAAPSQLVGMPVTKFVHPDYLEGFRAGMEALLGCDAQPMIEMKVVRLDGRTIDVELVGFSTYYGGDPAVQMIIRDITERKRLQETEKRLATAVSQSADAVAITDSAGCLQYVNPAFERITGYKRAEVLGRRSNFLEITGLDEALGGYDPKKVSMGEVWQGRVVGKRKDGTPFHQNLTVSPVRDSSGQICNRVGVGQDIAQQVQLERQLLHAQKMEAIGTMAGGIAHDMNNVLQVTLGFSQLLLTEKAENDPEYTDLMRIFQAAKSGAELVQQLLTFSRKIEPKLIPIALNRQVMQTVKLLRRTIPRMVDIELKLSDDLPRINADPTQIEQVLMNLALNARDAMPDGGKLTFTTESVAINDEYCRLHVGAEPGEYILLTVSDTGPGMDKAFVEHIFEPFYTIKETGQGSGLGLAMVYGIVKQHGGHISCVSKVGRGTVFEVYFPVFDSKLEFDSGKTAITPVFGTETILLVDDGEFMRDLGARLLVKYGYKILVAENGREALDIFKKEKAEISMVILDLNMPEMGGKECLKELLKIDANLRVLVASGYSAEASIKESLKIGAKAHISKPYRMEELLKLVRKILDKNVT